LKVCDLCALTAGPGIGTASAFGSYFFSRTQQFRLGKKTGLISNAEFARPTMFCLRSILPCLVGIALLSGTDTRAESPVANDAGSGFRFTYPVRDEGSSQVYTAPQPEPPAPAAPPASADPVVPAPPPLDPTPRSAASASQPVDVLADSYGGPGEAFQQVGAYDEAPADIGEGIFERRPFRFSFAVYEGYNSNVNTTSSNQIESLYTQIAAGVSYEFGTSRLQLSAALSAALAFYYNNVDLQNDGLFPTINFTLGANYAATPRLDLSLETYTAFLSQPNFTVAGAPTTYDGDYIISSTTFGVKYLWLPKFATETTYTPVFYYFTDEAQNDIQGRFEQTVGQQFIYLWKPTTSLVAEYDFNTRNFFTAKDLDSIGNFFLLGADHTLNPRSTVSVRGGVEQRFNQNPYGGTDVYVGPFGSINFNYALGEDTTVGLVSRYGTTASGFSNYTQAQQFLVGLNAAHQFTRRIGANAFINYQNNYYDQPGSDGAAPDFYDNIFNAGLNVSFLVYRNLSLLAGYSFTTLLSTDTSYERDYTQNIVYIGAELDF
jgi:hypothetical protein